MAKTTKGRSEVESQPRLITFPDIEPKLNGFNILEWRELIELAIKGRLLGDHLTEELVTKGSAAYTIWDAKEANIKHWRLQSMISDLRQNFLYKDAIKELWEEIKKNFMKQNNDWRLYELNIRSIQVRQGEDHVMVYECRPEAIWREIDHFWPVEDPRSAERIYFKAQIIYFLMGLNPTYEGLRMLLLLEDQAG